MSPKKDLVRQSRFIDVLVSIASTFQECECRLEEGADAFRRGTEESNWDCRANLAKSGDFPLRAISRITDDEKSREIAAN